MASIDVAEYKQQLLAVEQALLAAGDSAQQAELQALRENLLELLQLATTGSAVENEGQDDAEDAEMQRFMREMAELEENKQETEADKADAESQLQELRNQIEQMVGQKCSAPHEHSWGSVAYHNALVCGVGDGVELESDGSLDMRVRVLYTNPTHREMLPCEYYLGGECRFDDSKCHFSHGELVPMQQLRAYAEPDFELLGRNCVVLAKLQDRMWHRGKVLCVNFVEKTCRVRLDGKEVKHREQDFDFEHLLPMFQDDEEESDSSDGSDSSSAEEDSDDYESARQARLVEQSLLTCQPSLALGEWEKHTRGIASKLMAKMGYVHGTGLGSDGRGIITPVSAQVLPKGRSLDHCMEMRDLANGDADLFNVEKKLRREQKKQEAANVKAYEREVQRVDVFSFLNNSVLSTTKVPAALANGTKPSELKEHSNKALNVQSVRIADDIRRKEREISKVRESLKRNSSNVAMVKRLEALLNAQTNELLALQKEERSLGNEQAKRKTKDKMCVF